MTVVTVSDSHTPEKDTHSHFLYEQMALGHPVLADETVPDEPELVTVVLHQLQN
jgi:hypothetical protein